MAYWIGNWQGILALKVEQEPHIRNAASLELAAKAAARAKAEERYQKLVADSTSTARNNGIDLAKDLKGGLAKLAAMPTGEKAQNAYAAAFASWAKDPAQAAAAAATAEALSAGLEKMAALKGTANGWAQADPQKCLDWASGLPVGNADVLKTALAEVSNPRNDNRQPALAAQYVGKLPDASLRNEAIQAIGKNWANGLQDPGSGEGAEPAAALDWLNQVAIGDTYDQTVKDIFGKLSGDNPSLAATLIDKVTEPDVRDVTIGEVAYGLSHESFNSAVQWLQSLPDTDKTAKDNALTSIVVGLAERDPAEANTFMLNSPNATTYLTAAVTNPNVMEYLEPQLALNWVNALPAGDTKDNALNSALVHMAKADFDSAWSYAANLPDGAGAYHDMDGTVTGTVKDSLLSELTNTDPAKAASLIAQLPSGAGQLDAIKTVAETWVVKDMTGFVQWVNGLPPGSEHDAAVAQAINSVKNYQGGRGQFPAPESASLLQKLNQAITGKPTP